MFFVGYTFTAYKYTLDSIPNKYININTIILRNGIYDDLYVSNNVDQAYSTTIPTDWDNDTIMIANFNDNTYAGNVAYALNNIDTIRIKRRVFGTFEWITIFEKSISSTEDMNFELYDITARSSVSYEYAAINLSGLVEGHYVINNIDTYFQGLFIMDRYDAFNSIMDVNIGNQQQNKPVSVIQTMGSKYPFIISNGLTNYKSGDISTVFVSGDNCNYDFDYSWKFRERLNDFLYNNHAKLIKFFDGRMYLCYVSNSQISESEKGIYKLVETSFQWSEIGNCESGRDLYKYGFIDVNQ